MIFPLDAFQWALKAKGISSPAFRVLLVMTDLVDTERDDFVIEMDMPYLMKGAEEPLETVKQCINELLHTGLVSLHPEGILLNVHLTVKYPNGAVYVAGKGYSREDEQ